MGCASSSASKVNLPKSSLNTYMFSIQIQSSRKSVYDLDLYKSKSGKTPAYQVATATTADSLLSLDRHPSINNPVSKFSKDICYSYEYEGIEYRVPQLESVASSSLIQRRNKCIMTKDTPQILSEHQHSDISSTDTLRVSPNRITR